jgi:uncharacterized protein YndB with AHSA1/START domain
MNSSTFVYATYIATTPEKLWAALTEGDFTEKYWFGYRIESDWKEGSRLMVRNPRGKVSDEGIVLKSEPYSLLSYTFTWLEDKTVRDRPTVVTFELRQIGETVRLTLKHSELLPSDFHGEDTGFAGYNNGWPAILSGLKSVLENGRSLGIPV